MYVTSSNNILAYTKQRYSVDSTTTFTIKYHKKSSVIKIMTTASNLMLINNVEPKLLILMK